MARLPDAFTVRDARAWGVDDRRLRSRREWQHPYRGIRAAPDARWIDTVGVRVRAAGTAAFLFGPSALRAWGLELPGRRGADDGAGADADVHIAVPRPGRAPRGQGILGYSVGIDDVCVTRLRGIRITTRARTWVDLARWIGMRDLVAVGDRLCLPEEDLCSQSELETALALSPRVRGAASLRSALALVVPGAESYPESQIRVSCELAGLPRPLVNEIIRDGREQVARVDLLFERWGVIVEYEGAHHALDQRQWRRDLTRIGELQRLGYIVERAHADDLRDPTRLVSCIRTHLLRRGWTAGG